MARGLWVVMAVALPVLVSCRIKFEPIKVEPIHITMDINIRVAHELDKFFAFEDQLDAGATNQTGAAVSPGKTGKEVAP